MMEKLFGLGKFAGLEKIPDGWRETKDSELLFGKGGGNLVAGSGAANRSNFRQIGGLFRRTGQRRRREQGDGIGFVGGQIMRFPGAQRRNGHGQRK